MLGQWSSEELIFNAARDKKNAHRDTRMRVAVGLYEGRLYR